MDVDSAAKKSVSGAMGLCGERSPCAIDIGNVVDVSCSTDLEEFRSVVTCNHNTSKFFQVRDEQLPASTTMTTAVASEQPPLLLTPSSLMPSTFNGCGK